MRYWLMIFTLLMALSPFCYTAEFLVRAKGHWMDNYNYEQIDNLTSEQYVQFNARTQTGDIVVVRPDGWEWGREECLPNFIVIKIPGVAIEDGKKYEQPLRKEIIKQIERYVDKDVWDDEVKQADFIKEGNFISVPLVKSEKTVVSEKTVTVEKYNAAKVSGDYRSIGFSKEPVDVTAEWIAKGNVLMGVVALRQEIPVYVVSGDIKENVVVKIRKYQISLSVLGALKSGDKSVMVIEPKDTSIFLTNIQEKTQ